jgi:hypothetical protein
VKLNCLTEKLAAIITVICCGCIFVFVPATAKTERLEQLPAISQVEQVSSTKNHVDFYEFKGAVSRSEQRPIPPDSAARLKSIAQIESPSISTAPPDGISGDSKPAAALYKIRGDVNESGTARIAEVISLINYIFAGGPAPDPLMPGAVDCINLVSIADAVSLINYILDGPPVSCAACP